VSFRWEANNPGGGNDWKLSAELVGFGEQISQKADCIWGSYPKMLAGLGGMLIAHGWLFAEPVSISGGKDH
jgi:hypothetical protein